MKGKVLLTHRIPKEGLRKIENDFEITVPDKKHFTYKELEKMLPDYDALIPVFGFEINKELIERADKLKIIANFGVGYNNIDVQAASAKGIPVTNTPKTVIEPTAELTFALLLSLVRRVSELDARLKNKEPLEWDVMSNLGHTLENKTLGIIGMGNIGKSVALKAAAFGMKVIYYTRTPLGYTDEKTYKAEYVPIEELIEKSDIISLHTPLTKDTKHLLGEEQFKKMQKGTFIINTARGAVINEKQLIKYLQNGHLGGAGLDVFEFEPEISSELLEMDNVVLCPHIGTANYETRRAIAEEAASNIDAWFKGYDPPNIVNRNELNQ
ncbi:MAG: NAD(P)-dependent oxidoreductase, partial [Bacteroidota bacterium]